MLYEERCWDLASLEDSMHMEDKVAKCHRKLSSDVSYRSLVGSSIVHPDWTVFISEVKVTQSCPTLWPHGLCSPWNSLGQNTGVGSLSLLQRIFPIQGLNPGLLHCRQILYQLSHKEGPNSGTSESAFPRVSSNLQWDRICFQTENSASVISNPLLSLSKEYQRFIILLWHLRSWSGALKDKLAFGEAVHL